MKSFRPFAFLFMTLWLALTAVAGPPDKVNPIPFDAETQKYTYAKVIEVPGVLAPELYQRSKAWMIQKYTNDKFVVEKDGAQLSQLGSFSINMTLKVPMVGRMPFVYTVTYNLTSLVKDGRCKLIISDIKLAENGKGTAREQTIESFEKQADTMGIGRKSVQNFVLDTFLEIDRNLQPVITAFEQAAKGGKSSTDW